MMRYKSLAIIIAILPNEAAALVQFVDFHRWFLLGGGRVIVKSSGEMLGDISTIFDQNNDGKLELVEKTDGGIYEAWNQAFDYLESVALAPDYVCFMGVDDRLREEFCIMVSEMSDQPSMADFLYADSIRCFRGRSKLISSPTRSTLFSLTERRRFDVPHPGLMNKWELVRGLRFNATYSLAGDLDFYIRVGKLRVVDALRLDCVQVQIGSDGMSNSLQAYRVYLREWLRIQSDNRAILDVPWIKFYCFTLLAKLPPVFSLLRKLSWLVRARSD